jgi:hypothetical protein
LVFNVWWMPINYLTNHPIWCETFFHSVPLSR